MEITGEIQPLRKKLEHVLGMKPSLSRGADFDNMNEEEVLDVTR